MSHRKPRVEIQARSVNPTAGVSAPAKARRDPVAAAITEEFPLDTPGVGHALTRLRAMKAEGQEITLEVARACIQTFVDYHARLAQQEADRKSRAIVYYMLLGNRVKIGTTTNLTLRKQSLGAEEVLAIEPGDCTIERERHQQFAHLRTSGEWFRHESPLTEWIDKVRERHGNGVPPTA